MFNQIFTKRYSPYGVEEAHTGRASSVTQSSAGNRLRGQRRRGRVENLRLRVLRMKDAEDRVRALYRADVGARWVGRWSDAIITLV